MFIGREVELNALERLYQSDKFEMAVIYGRRRVGKSELIKKFCGNRVAINYTAVENSAHYNLEGMFVNANEAAHNIMAHSTGHFVKGYSDVLDLIVQIAKVQKLIFVIDEYPYLAKADKSFSSLLQKYIDNQFKNLNIKIILCGSSMSFMENQVLGYKSPLYGRRTAQLKIEPFNYHDTAKFVPHYSKEDKLLTYGILGGTPYYLAQLDNEISLQDNVERLFFSTSGLLFEEPNNLIKQELREPQVYNAIITAMANGSTKGAEIATKVRKPANLVDTYIKKLMSLGLIKKEKPIGEKTSTKSVYVLSDNMFKFWFKYVQDNMSLITRGLGNKVIETVWTKINDYMGKIFEDICVQFLWENYSSLPLQPKEIGRWWGNNSKEKREEKIDIVAFDANKAIFGECKYKNEKTGIDCLENLKRKSNLFRQENKTFYLFSKSGFTDELILLDKAGEVKLLGLANLI